ncbi:DNA-directed RNA polymerase II subunit RPB1-like [Anopheles arabiensis]|uniref:DNA-directed RNA polymerase II subunit RPB1-like n=1 Tax=Anopheles arabiensis TaxID=7173 RepID=UPI001AAC521F|nr:DNA-directed RNA polymerase II subunit RPB1-like [Anopheles arabiensis]
MQQAELIVAQHHGKHSLTIDGTSYPLPILLEDGATEVRLHELPPYVTGAEIETAMCCFGKVVSITETEYGPDSKVPGKKTGIIAVKIILRSPAIQIGPTMTIADERTTVTYNGQNPYCRYCLMPEHTGMGCMQSKRSLAKQGASYAGVTKATAPASASRNNTPSKAPAKTLKDTAAPHASKAIAPKVYATPKAPTVAPKAPTVSPKAPTVAPKAPTVAPTEPTIAPRALTVAPTEASSAPTASTSSAQGKEYECTTALVVPVFKIPRDPSPTPPTTNPDPDTKD